MPSTPSVDDDPVDWLATRTAPPATVTTVPKNHPRLGRTERHTHSRAPAKNGPTPTATTVPTATPVRSTATRNVGV